MVREGIEWVADEVGGSQVSHAAIAPTREPEGTKALAPGSAEECIARRANSEEQTPEKQTQCRAAAGSASAGWLPCQVATATRLSDRVGERKRSAAVGCRVA